MSAGIDLVHVDRTAAGRGQRSRRRGPPCQKAHLPNWGPTAPQFVRRGVLPQELSGGGAGPCAGLATEVILCGLAVPVDPHTATDDGDAKNEQ